MKINDRDAISADKFRRRAIMRALRKGQEGMIEAGETFLPKETGEKPADYEKRLNRTILFNATKKAIQSLVGKPFSKPVSFEVDERYNDKVSLLNKSFSSNGDSLTITARTAFVNGLWDGLCHLLVDKSATTVEGLPYVTIVRDDSILAAEEVNGELVLLRILESYKRVSEDGMSVQRLQRVRVFRKLNGVVEWALFDERPDKKGEFENKGWNQHSLDYIPLVTFYASPEESEFMSCDSPLLDLAYENIGHWQNSSDQKNILHVARVPILFARGLEENQQITIGPSAMIVGNSDNADMKFVEINGSSLSAGRDSIKDQELRMQALGLEMMTLKSGAETATGQAIAADSTNSALASMAISLASALDRVFKMMGEFMLIQDLDVTVNIHTDYGITMSTQELQALATARQLGDLSHEDYMSELKRRGVLRSSFDMLDNKDRIEAESNEIH